MNIEAYRVFLVCAESKSFQEAADKLRLTSSALSGKIIFLEKELDCTLFDRKAKGPVLTLEGELKLPAIRQMISDSDKMKEVTGSDAGSRAKLLIPIAPPICRYNLNDMLNAFHTENQDILVLFREKNGTVAEVQKGICQLAFFSMVPASEAAGYDITAFPVGKLGILVSEKDTLTEKKQINAKDLLGKQLYAQNNPYLKKFLHQYFHNCSDIPEIDFSLSKEENVILKVMKEHKIAITTSDIVSFYHPKGCAFIPLDGDNTVYGEFAHKHGVQLNAEAERFRQFTVQWLTEKRNAVQLTPEF